MSGIPGRAHDISFAFAVVAFMFIPPVASPRAAEEMRSRERDQTR